MDITKTKETIQDIPKRFHFSFKKTDKNKRDDVMIGRRERVLWRDGDVT